MVIVEALMLNGTSRLGEGGCGILYYILRFTNAREARL